MKPTPKPHPTQSDAIRNPAARLFIEAGPGTGKTFAVAERFGYLAFRPGPNDPRVLALSFTVSATRVLRRALTDRWGRHAGEFPHRVQTFDSLFRDLLEFLLRSGLVEWPGGLVSIEPLDEWSSRQPAPPRNPVSWEPTLADSMKVVATKRFVGEGELVVTAKRRLMPQLEVGACTHDSVRDIVIAATLDGECRQRLLQFLRSLANSVIVDELFDANASDVALLALLIEAGCDMTVVGDPWQALYDFRHSTPGDVEADLLGASFTRSALPLSFRFTPESVAERVALQVRSANPCDPLVVVDKPDVVLGATWRELWSTGPEVLPMAFGQVHNGLDALMALLLDHVARAQGFPGSRFADSAPTKLGVDAATVAESTASAMDPIIERLVSTEPAPVADALDMLSLVPKHYFGAAKKVAIRAETRVRHEPLLAALADRIRQQGPFTPGLTVHQAKGNEWDRVALAASPADNAAMASGLDITDPDHRRLYVALTRGRIVSGKYA